MPMVTQLMIGASLICLLTHMGAVDVVPNCAEPVLSAIVDLLSVGLMVAELYMLRGLDVR